MAGDGRGLPGHPAAGFAEAGWHGRGSCPARRPEGEAVGGVAESDLLRTLTAGNRAVVEGRPARVRRVANSSTDSSPESDRDYA